MLDKFQRSTVEQIRSHRGRVSITLHSGVILDDNGTSITTGTPDRKLAHDIAIALQGYYNRQNTTYYGDEDRADL